MSRQFGTLFNKRIVAILLAGLLVVALTACGAGSEESAAGSSNEAAEEQSVEQDAMAQTDEADAGEDMILQINGNEVPVIWESNEAVDKLRELVAGGGIEIQMSMYGGNEQVGPIGSELPSDDEQTTTKPGDIVLYSSNQMVIFYGSNSWAYTRLGRIAGMSDAELADLLGNGDVTVAIMMKDRAE